MIVGIVGKYVGICVGIIVGGNVWIFIILYNISPVDNSITNNLLHWLHNILLISLYVISLYTYILQKWFKLHVIFNP